MSLSRRRFLAISAAAVAAPVPATAASWSGIAFGSDVRLTIRAPGPEAARAIGAARRIIAEVEDLFSLYRDGSALIRLNRTGRLDRPDPRFITLMHASDRAHRLTSGRFDPTVQPYWRAHASGEDPARARAAFGWHRIAFDDRAVRLAPGQALTFNGIAQGYATDLVSEALSGLGLTDVLVNMGEYRALGGPWRLGIADPQVGLMGFQTLTHGAVATSSPSALTLGAHAHILHPDFTPRWSTVSVTAANAALADSLSTALCLAPVELVEEIAAMPQVASVRLVDMHGDLATIQA